MPRIGQQRRSVGICHDGQMGIQATQFESPPAVRARPFGQVRACPFGQWPARARHPISRGNAERAMTDAFPADPLAAFSNRLAALTAEAAARVVAVHGRDGRARSGLLWAEGLVVTAEEALERDDELSLTLPDGRMVPATLAGRDPGTDVALLKAATGAFAPLPVAPPAALATGHVLLAVGRGEYGPGAAFGPASPRGGPPRAVRRGPAGRRTPPRPQ